MSTSFVRQRIALPIVAVAALAANALWLAPPAVSPLSAAPHLVAGHGSRQALFRKGKKQKKQPPPTGAELTVVQDIRVKAYPSYTRLVLDLQRAVPFTQRHDRNPDRLLLELPNTKLGPAAQSRLGAKELPSQILIAEGHINRSTPKMPVVYLSVNMDSLGDYKLLPLANPDRLVLDVYPRPAPESPPDSSSPPAPPSPTAPQPTPPPEPSPQPAKVSPSSPRREIKLIVIDPGHGGKDPGAIGRHGLAEKEVTLRVGLHLRDLIESRLQKQALMTRDRDVFIELEDRAKFANGKDADLFVSIHVNSHPQRTTKGLEVYHFGEASDRRALAVAARENGTPIGNTGVGWQYLVADLLTTKKIQESLDLAWSTKNSMVAHLNQHYDIVDHGVKTAPFYVIRFTTMPSILAEIAFISNPTEERLMETDAFLKRMAEAIFEGIRAYVAPLQTAAR
jgi:N-acetylmuramoyl-L-alanine amidase